MKKNRPAADKHFSKTAHMLRTAFRAFTAAGLLTIVQGCAGALVRAPDGTVAVREKAMDGIRSGMTSREVERRVGVPLSRVFSQKMANGSVQEIWQYNVQTTVLLGYSEVAAFDECWLLFRNDTVAKKGCPSVIESLYPEKWITEP